MGTGTTLQDKDFLVPHRLLMEALSLSVCPNDTHPYIELNHEPDHKHNQLLGGNTLLCGGGDPYTTDTQQLHIFKLCY